MKAMWRIHIMLAVMLLVGLVQACGSDDGVDESYTHFRYDLVTYGGREAGADTYVLEGRDDEPATTLVADNAIAGDREVGTRVLLRYAFVDANTAQRRSIAAYSVTGIISDTLRAAWRTHGDLTQHPVRLRSMWRTGNYLNLHCQVEYTGKARRFSLVADSATLAADTVHCYLIHNPLTTELLQWRECYASYYIAGLWQRESCRVLRVHIVDEVAPQTTTYDFGKQ